MTFFIFLYLHSSFVARYLLFIVIGFCWLHFYVVMVEILRHVSTFVKPPKTHHFDSNARCSGWYYCLFSCKWIFISKIWHFCILV